ncbi:unnamed protein product [Schistosoma rodhaini]|uniref:Protein-L-isoaspartate O-methyltransferase domain-containing protein n=1 Tax=Schistosoma rodhaini TaxID=6188 RepID=A0AA85EJY0_9TREM|nr:unnamed protein product [Schistosoma rodhaini]
MGGHVSRGRDNQSLIDELVRNGLTLNPETERALRLVDRGGYFNEKSPRAYMDMAWRSGSLHLSAPSIYIVALKNLDIQPGNRFLNVGSGTGYLSTVIGLLLGYNGVNHGIEVNDFNVNFSREHLVTFLSECDAPFERSFCPPVFLHGNILDLIVRPVQQPGMVERLNDFPQPSEMIQNNLDTHLNNSVINPENIWTSEGSQNHSSDATMEVEENDHVVNENIHQNDDPDNNNNDDDDDDNENESDPIKWEEEFIVESPPLIHSDSSHPLSNQTDTNVQPWPVYDRIYVGAAVTSRLHLQSILRLLKVGGILVVPYRDKFMKIKRTEENKITASELMSVSFATLLPSRIGSEKQVESPPKQNVISLEKLAARIIRNLLRGVIEFRHNGLPILGHMEEVEEGEGEENTMCDTNEDSDTLMNNTDIEELGEPNREGGDSVLQPRSPVSQNCSMARFLHYLINHAEIGNDGSPIEDTNSNRTNSGDVQNDTTGDNALDAETGGFDGTATENHHSNSPYLRINFCRFLNGVSNTIIGTSTVCEHSNEDEDNQINGILNTSASVDNESTIDEDVKNKSTPHKQRKKYRWVPPSYTYKEEMKRMLSEELRLGKPLIRSVITL